MKTQSFIRKGFFILMALCLSMGFQSCLDDDNDDFYLHITMPMHLSQ